MSDKMNAYRLTWNPNRPEYRDDIQVDGPHTWQWRCGKARIREGTRIYLVRLGLEPKGLIGVGRALEEPSTGDDPRVWIEFEKLDPEPRIPLEDLKKDYPHVAWENQNQAIIVPEEVVVAIDNRMGIAPSKSRKTSGARKRASATDSKNLEPDIHGDVGLEDLESYDPKDETDARKRIQASIAARSGNRKFRKRLLSAYGERCAISGCNVVQVLDAAHIMPFRGAHTNYVVNGLLLRTDLHTLFDRHLLCIDPDDDYKVYLTNDLRSSSSGYKRFHGKPMRRPGDHGAMPNTSALRRHRGLCDWYQSTRDS